MSSQQESALQRALAIRLNLQISISGLPVVEEWMDTHLTRWLEHVPTPPELPRGYVSNFIVILGSDLSRVTWSAYGNPAGFIPKMGTYFEKAQVSKNDVTLLDQLGNELEPELVGSWITAAGGKLKQGWQFADEHPWAAIQPAFADHAAKEKLAAWLADEEIDTFQRFSQAVGTEPHSEIEFAVKGVAIDDQLESAARAFDALAGAPFPDYVVKALSESPEPRFSVSVRIEGGAITRVAVQSPTLGNDIVSALCKDAGIAYEDRVAQIQGALGAEGSERIEYIRADGRELLDLHLVPSDLQNTTPPTSVN